MDGKLEQMMVEEVPDCNHKHCNQFVDFRIVNFLNNCNHHRIDRTVAVERQLVVVEQLVVENFVVILDHFLVTNHDVYDYLVMVYSDDYYDENDHDYYLVHDFLHFYQVIAYYFHHENVTVFYHDQKI